MREDLGKSGRERLEESTNRCQLAEILRALHELEAQTFVFCRRAPAGPSACHRFAMKGLSVAKKKPLRAGAKKEVSPSLKQKT